MNQEILNFAPQRLWQHFEELNAIPRASKNEAQVIDFIKNFGIGLGLETTVDQVGNVLIRKPATAGHEDRPGVILQGHLDMVHQKNSDKQFDFASQGIESYVEDGWLKARGTTLGADNGIGVASIMAVLSATDLKHGPLEALFTIDEETGMTGAFALEPGFLQGQILLNTDTEDEGELCIGCAGGIDTNVSLEYQPVPSGSNRSAFQIAVTGLRGGHSGCDIHLGRGNANKIINRLLWDAFRAYEIEIATVDGGGLRNAIPRESFATITVPNYHLASWQDAVTRQFHQIKAELEDAEPGLSLSIEPAEFPLQVIDPTTQLNLLNLIYAAPCGVIRMSDSIPGLVETSTNLARVLAKEGQVSIQFLTRSSVDSAKRDVANQVQALFELAGGQAVHEGSYPGWRPNRESKILAEMRQLYEELFHVAPQVNAVHAGLECGIIGRHYPQLDMISFGPTIKNPHSPDEKCDIASVEKYWKFLVATLAS